MNKRYSFPSFMSIVDGHISHLTTINRYRPSNASSILPQILKDQFPQRDHMYPPYVLAWHAQHMPAPSPQSTIELIFSHLRYNPNHHLLICGNPLTPKNTSPCPTHIYHTHNKISQPFDNGRVGDQGIGI